MADDRPQPVDQFASTDTPAEHDETNWGEDWESAFQAEDDAFFSDEKDEGFFLEEKAPTVTAGVAAPDIDTSLEKTLSGIPDHSVTTAEGGLAKKLVDFAAITAFFLSLKSVALSQFNRLQSFPLLIRIPLYILPFLIIVGIFALSGKPQAPAVSPQKNITAPADTQPSPTVSREENQASSLHPGKIRKKWAFPSFIIPINNQDSTQPVTFVLVDITLIASFAEEEDPPAEKKIFVRDIIYQFFQNKSLEELRRYSLARGEMNKELRAWLLKQWPEAPIESIIFNQYHLS